MNKIQFTIYYTTQKNKIVFFDQTNTALVSMMFLHQHIFEKTFKKNLTDPKLLNGTVYAL